MFSGTSISEALRKDFERVLGGQNHWFSLFCRWFFEVIFGARIERSTNRKKLPTRELGEFFRGGSVSWRHGFGKAKKGVRQESVTISHAQRPPSADAADLIGSAIPPTPRTSNVRLPLEHGSDRHENLAKRFSDDLKLSIFWLKFFFFFSTFFRFFFRFFDIFGRFWRS